MATPVPDVKFDDWTWEDLADLPEGPRYEIVDGALVVTPPPITLHDVLIAELCAVLRSAAPVDLIVFGPTYVGKGRTYRGPDLVVARREAVRARPKLLAPEDVLLAVEVLSPSTTTTDKVTKRFEYEDAGIPAYWLLDPQAPSLTVLSGADEGLTALGDGVVRLTAPFPVEIRPADLLP